jgi:hypothetical protein
METQKYNPWELIAPLETLPHGGDIILLFSRKRKVCIIIIFVPALKITNIVMGFNMSL